MSTHRRILIEWLGPPFLAAFLTTIFITTTGRTGDSISDTVVRFPAFVCVAYMLGIVPSLLYMLAMEVWFRKGLHARYGMLCTVCLSSLLGTGAAFVIQLVLQAITMGMSFLPSIGAFVGCLIGLYVGRQQPANSQQRTPGS